MATDFKTQAARRWFGYGRWDAPFWFVGMEPGGDEDPRVYETWHDLGATELLDLYAHSRACDDMKWVGPHPPIQRTWAQLIRIVLGYQGAPTETEDVRNYQRDRLGRVDGDTLLVELSSVNARNLGVAVPEREQFRAERVNLLRQRLREAQPDFAVFYRLGYRTDYEDIAGDRFDVDGLCQCGTTICALVPHPVGRPTKTSAWWSDIGHRLRSLHG